ncbi:MAG TPA: hypothetical protein VJ975_01660 [Candidatus Limnocylindria bacterium]|nr:hypothetical protein [Candidatus Limnocylindria bacterium]
MNTTAVRPGRRSIHDLVRRVRLALHRATSDAALQRFPTVRRYPY